MKLMARYEDNHFDLAIVDPPYGINADEEQNKQNESNRISNGGKWKKYHETKWDNEVPSLQYFKELERVSKNQIIWGGNYFFNLNLSGVIVWNKFKNLKMKEGELAKTSFNTFKLFNMSRTDAYINKCDSKIHPTQKPTQLYEWLLMNYAKEGDKILDTHLGSGSIAIACHNLKFDLTACELDKEYFDSAMKRIKRHQQQIQMF
jgi:site-specific DNA-methyltransferase (adenine-specific)